MQIEVLGGEVSISKKKGESVLEITVLENGIPGYIPPDWITIEVTPDEARLIASALLEVQKQIKQAPLENSKKSDGIRELEGHIVKKFGAKAKIQILQGRGVDCCEKCQDDTNLTVCGTCGSTLCKDCKIDHECLQEKPKKKA